jgi:hypothetical protein
MPLPLTTLLRYTRTLAQVAAHAPLIADSARSVWQFSTKVYDDMRTRRGAIESGSGPSQASATYVTEARLLAELEDLQRRLVEHADVVARLAQDTAETSAILRGATVRLFVALLVGSAGLLGSLASIILVLSR